jgi:hypothetical protein
MLLSACALWLVSGFTGRCVAGDASSGKSAAVDYLRDVKPLLSKHCYACHGALKQKARLRLDTAAMLRKGGDSGPAITAGQSDESLITDALTGREGWKMPPEGEGSPLSVQEIGTVRAWIDLGAKAPADERPQKDPRDHWAFQSPVRPAVPRVSRTHAGWVRNPIDAFLAEKHEQKGLVPALPAAPGELIRRVYLDLIGLAPSPEDVRRFVANPSDQAYAELVDRLLASPQYGERWGRHWMDVWRYSDWDGFGTEIRESQPHIWRWRDWIVESLNADRGYDRMITLMLAADEAEPADPRALRATGFLVRNWYKFSRNIWLDATVEHTSKAFLGLTLNCARCHDHKYDPIAQADYYRFRAFFEPHSTRIDPLPDREDTKKDGLVRVYDSDLTTPTFLFTRGDDKRPVQDRPLAAGVPPILERQSKLEAIKPVALAPELSYPALSRKFQEQRLTRARAEFEAREGDRSRAEKSLALAKDPAAMNKARVELDLARKGELTASSALFALECRITADRARYSQPPRADAQELAHVAAKAERSAAVYQAEQALLGAELALVTAEQAAAGPNARSSDKARKAAAQARTKRDQARAELKSRRLALHREAKGYSPLGPTYPAISTGRRLALARWVASRGNSLTARVAINHIWMRHFGTPLVPTEFDFGNNGKAPTHPALLDWLAVELMDSGWSKKTVHRQIVTTSAYRKRSSSRGPSDPNLAIDPSNQAYWRMNPRRMEAEAVRDNLLFVAGDLDLTMGGPDIDPESGLTSPRRSLYFRHAKEKRVTFLRLFDSSNVQSCYRRAESIVPQQALALANSPLSFTQARRLAASVSSRSDIRGNDAAFVSKVFDRVLGRQPTPEERAECIHYLARQAERLADRTRLTSFPTAAKPAVPPANDPAQRARESLVHVLLNHNDFVTIR